MKLTLMLVTLLWGVTAFAQRDLGRDQGANSYAAFATNQTPLVDSALWKTLTEKLSLTYYFSLMGPSPGLPSDQTYNVFLEGPAPLQTFHAFNLRWQFNPDWAMGITASGIHHFTSPVTTDEGFCNDNNAEMFNLRAYVAVPSLDLKFARAFHTFSIEFPTTPGSRDDELKYGLVVSQALAFALPPSRFSAGWSTQFIRYKYAQATLPPPFVGGLPTPLQTTLLTTGPYANFQLAPQWQIASSVTFDWDQRGNQTDTSELNNNLPDRFRLALNHLFQTPPFTHVGVYLQGLTKPTMDTTIIGFDFSLKF
jgi:hypothetical protein